MSILLKSISLFLEENYSTWPEWAISSFICVSAICCALLIADFFDGKRHGGIRVDDKIVGNSALSFRKFQLKYLSVYLIVMLADWMQGTNMYTLYQSYGVNVGTLFLTGFSSSAIFGTFLGLFVDKYGRRLGCIAFCLLEIAINALEHYPHMGLLLLGRVLGGISTSLLFTAFESWMVSEHRRRQYPEAWLASTFGLATVGNGFVAIVAGIVAQIAADKLGHIGPFQCAIFLTILALLLLLFWEENYGGEERSAHKSNEKQANQTLRSSLSDAWYCITKNESVLLLGLIQSFFEGSMYTFVFMWVPTLYAVVPEQILPTGLVFSSFMVCVTIGGALTPILLRRLSLEFASAMVMSVAALSMFAPTILTSHFEMVLWSFFVLEMCVGAFYACSGLMRSRYLPEAHQGAIMNVFRLPLNIIVVIGTRLTDLTRPDVVFGVITLWFGLSALLQFRLCKINSLIKKDN